MTTTVSEKYGEKAVLVFFLTIAFYMVATSFQYDDTAAIFPQITGMIVIVFAIALLFREYFPEPLYSVLADAEMADESESKTEQSEDDDFGLTQDNFEQSLLMEEKEHETTVFGKEVPTAGLNRAVLTSLIGLYIVFSFLIGMLWVTPVFVLAYALYTRLPWYFTVSLPIVSYGIAYMFMDFVYLPINEGWIHSMGWL